MEIIKQIADKVIEGDIDEIQDLTRKAIEQKVCFAAEVGLSGEIRPVNRIEQRIQEAEKLGFEQIFVSKYNLKGLDIANPQITITPVKKIEDVFRLLFG